MLRKLLCLGVFASVVIIGLACGEESSSRPDLRGALTGKGELAWYFGDLAYLDWIKHQPNKELSCQGAPVTNSFQGYDSAHSYSYPAEEGTSYLLRFEGSHASADGIIVAVYNAETGAVMAIDGAYDSNSLKMEFDSPLTGKVIVAVFSANITATGAYNLSIACDGVGPVFCSDDSACTDGFCGCVDGACTGKVCKPWAKWGDACGGFVPPDHVTYCAPDLRCAGGHPAIDMPGKCAVMATVSEILQDLQKFEDKMVFISNANVQAVGGYCTKMACMQDDPCCNSCSASQRLYDAGVSPALPDNGLGLRGAFDDKTYTCSGSNCDYLDNCTVAINRPPNPPVTHYAAGMVRVIRAMDAPIQSVHLDVEDLGQEHSTW